MRRVKSFDRDLAEIMIQEEQATVRLQLKAVKLHQGLFTQSMSKLNESVKSDTIVQRTAMKALRHGI